MADSNHLDCASVQNLTSRQMVELAHYVEENSYAPLGRLGREGCALPASQPSFNGISAKKKEQNIGCWMAFCM